MYWRKMQGVQFFSMLLLLAQGNVNGWMPKAYIKPLIRNFHPSPTQTTVSSNPKSSENQLNPIIDDRLSLDMFSVRNFHSCFKYHQTRNSDKIFNIFWIFVKIAGNWHCPKQHRF